MTEQYANTTGFRHALVVASQCTFHQSAPNLKVNSSCRTPLPPKRAAEIQGKIERAFKRLAHIDASNIPARGESREASS
jgi:hypothetical protein